MPLLGGEENGGAASKAFVSNSTFLPLCLKLDGLELLLLALPLRLCVGLGGVLHGVLMEVFLLAVVFGVTGAAAMFSFILYLVGVVGRGE